MPDYSGHLLDAKTLARFGRSILGQYGQAREGDLFGRRRAAGEEPAPVCGLGRGD